MKEYWITRKEFKKFIETEFPFLTVNSHDNVIFRKISNEDFLPDKYYDDIEPNIWLGSYNTGYFDYPDASNTKELVYKTQLQQVHLFDFIRETINKNIHEIYRLYEKEFERLNKVRITIFENISKMNR
jgi:hypothetical protein